MNVPTSLNGALVHLYDSGVSCANLVKVLGVSGYNIDSNSLYRRIDRFRKNPGHSVLSVESVTASTLERYLEMHVEALNLYAALNNNIELVAATRHNRE